MKTIEVSGRKIGLDSPCFIIAEAGVNHNGEVDLAKRLVKVAANAGADAVKFQTFKADRVVTSMAPKAQYQLHSTRETESQLDMLRRLELPIDAYQKLMSYCRAKGITFLSSPFDKESVDFLDNLGVPAFKISSGEITNSPFLSHVGRKRKPIILSTGMAYIGEVEAAVNTIKKAGNQDLILLHCVSSYPAEPGDVNLRAIRTMETAFGVPVGYSDHTVGIEVAFAAVALGACVIEKHFTLDRKLPGPDHQASLEPEELAALVRGIRTVEAALGHGRKEPVTSEANTAAVARKSLVAGLDIKAGTRLTEEMIAIKRPGTGLSPAMRPHVVGRTLCVDVAEGTLLTWEMLA
jgi:N-acetylneuraminate synthase